MLDSVYLLEYSKVFEEQPENFSSYLNGLGIDKIVDICSNFLSLRPNHPEVVNYQELIFHWFSKDNIEFREYVYSKINQIDPILRRNLQIINVYCIYQLFEYSIEKLPPTTSLSISGLEVPLFKTILCLNEEFNTREKIVLKSTEEVESTIDLYSKGITHFLCYFDLSVYDLRELIFTQFVKSYLLFRFLEDYNEGTRNILQRFLLDYGISDWKDYLRRLIKFTHGLISPDREGYLTVSIVDDDKDNSTLNFFNKIIVDDTISYDDLDFIKLREKPIYKIEEKKYRVISPLFLCEKIYQGLFFQLNDINRQIGNERISNISEDFRGFYCSKFTEEFLLYNIMERVFPRKYIKYSGKSLREKGITGEPDYYVRNGTKVFLFESKDVLLNKGIKQSNDFHQIEQGLREKFYEYKKNGQIRKLGVFQLIENVKRVLHEENDFDKPNVKTVRIYPILIVYHNVFNTPGINGLVNHWFKTELKNLQNEGINIDCVHDLVIIDVNLFILYHELFKSSRLSGYYALIDPSYTLQIDPPKLTALI